MPKPLEPVLDEERQGLDSPRSRRAWAALALAAGTLFVILAFHAASLETPTVDEFAHVAAGAAHLRHGSFRLYAKTPPLLTSVMALPLVMRGDVTVPPPRDLSLSWGPWSYGYQFMQANRDVYLGLFLAARCVTIILGCLTGAVLFAWARRVFGVRAAAVTTALFFLNPVVLAHGHLATVDTGCMFTIFLGVFVLHRACARPSWARVTLAGIVWGVALLVKFTAVLMLPIFAVLIAVHRRDRPARGAAELAATALCAVITVNAGMGFKGSFLPAGEFEPRSSFGRSMQKMIPHFMPVPLPEDYVVGFDTVKFDTEKGEFGSYLLGRWSPSGWWYYDLVAFVVKTPLPILLLLALSPRFLLRRRLPPRENLGILAPLGILMVMMTAFNRMDIGIRYLLPIFPFLYLLTASVWERRPKGRTWLWPGAVAAASLAGALSVHPDYLTYFNLAAGGPANGHRVLIDSNLDWGQDLYRVRPAVERLGYDGEIALLYYGHVDPALYGIRYALVPSWEIESVIVVSVNYLMGYPYPATSADGRIVPIKADHLAWLRSREPVAREGSIWIFDTRKGIGAAP